MHFKPFTIIFAWISSSPTAQLMAVHILHIVIHCHLMMNFLMFNTISILSIFNPSLNAKECSLIKSLSWLIWNDINLLVRVVLCDSCVMISDKWSEEIGLPIFQQMSMDFIFPCLSYKFWMMIWKYTTYVCTDYGTQWKLL